MLQSIATRLAYRSNIISASFLLTVGLVLPPIALAQDVYENSNVLEEVIVTAQKREQNVQDIAASIAVMSAGTLADMGAGGYEGFAQALPSLQFTESRPGATQISPRGVSPIAGLGAPVSIYMDEMLVTGQTGIQQDIRTFDVARNATPKKCIDAPMPMPVPNSSE